MLRQYLQSEAQERHNVTVELEDAQSSGGFVDDRHLIVRIDGRRRLPHSNTCVLGADSTE
jgi:hypothetical protein